MPLDKEQNLVLIGMPGVGKSTIGVLLAKHLARGFVDTDVVIQSREGESLQHIIDTRGVEVFCRLEERYVLSLRCRGAVVATGGSVVYSEAAISHLSAHGLIVHLEAALPTLHERLEGLGARGVVMAPGQSLEELHRERLPLYRRYAEVTVACDGLNHEETVRAVIRACGERR